MRASLRWSTLCAVVAATASCAAPLQNGSIAVQPGAEARLDLMCRYRPDSGGAQQACAASAEE